MCLLDKAERVGLAPDIDFLLCSSGQYGHCDPETSLLLQEARESQEIEGEDLEPREILTIYLGQ
jgi:hypothetical protein